eukprot:9094444-Pyramimonas_sp.AAC.1
MQDLSNGLAVPLSLPTRSAHSLPQNEEHHIRHCPRTVYEQGPPRIQGVLIVIGRQRCPPDASWHTLAETLPRRTAALVHLPRDRGGPGSYEQAWQQHPRS